MHRNIKIVNRFFELENRKSAQKKILKYYFQMISEEKCFKKLVKLKLIYLYIGKF